MTNIHEMQFELLRDEGDQDGALFGFGLPVAVNEGGFDPGELAFLTQDSRNPVNGTDLYGRDIPTGRTWTWQMHVDEEDTPGALAALGVLTTAWRGDGLVSRPGWQMCLRYKLGGRIRRVYGRPRRLASTPDNRIITGMIPLTAQFSVVDSLHYADTVDSVTLNYTADSNGGFVLPAVMPIHTLQQSEQNRSISVGGDIPCYPLIRFEGPITNPYLTGPGWTVSLDLSLQTGEYAEIDTRPWKMTVLKNGTAGVGGRLAKRQYLEDVRLAPGNHTLRFGGSSSSAVAACRVSWRSAYSSL